MFKCFVFIFVANVFASVKEPVEKRSHNPGPAWIDHCWDHGPGKVMDPFCALLYEKCEDAPEIVNGHHSQSYNKTVGSPVNYVCDDGYIMTGAEVIRCVKPEITIAPQWSQPPTCIKVTCPSIPDIENGYHESSNSTVLGTSIQYFCNEGYVFENNDTITCMITGAEKHLNWSQPMPKCKETLCSSPPQIINGYAILPNPLYVITTAVPDTSTLSETTSIPKQPSTTSKVPDTLNETATSLPNTSTDTDTVNYTTTPLPIANDNATDTDTVNYTTTPLPMANDNTTTISPESFSNTSVAQTDANNDTSIVMSDTSNVTATTVPDTSNDTDTDQVLTTTLIYPPRYFPIIAPGMEPTPAPDKEPTPAPGLTYQPGYVTATTVPYTPNDTSTISPYMPITNGTKFQINDTVVYQCNTGYGFVTSENMHAVKTSLEATCVAVNNTTAWSTTVVCVPAQFDTAKQDCMPVPDVENANHTSPLNTLQGSSVVYSCFSGFAMVGSSIVTCLPTGNWSELPFCRGCMDPPVVTHGTHNMNYGTSINSTVSYVCDDGYSMLGSEIITCQSLNQSPYAIWTDPPACTRACGPVPSIDKGSHTVPDNLLTGANVTYSCLNGSVMLGSPNVVCQASGNWSKLPVCDGVCITPPAIPNSIPTTRYVYNETNKVVFSCEEHYSLVGNDTLECIAGQWSTPYPYCECQIKPIDIVFIIDGSGSLGVHGFGLTIDFVVNMVKRFPIETTNFGLLTFSSDVYRQFYLNEYVNDTVGLIDRIRNTTFPTGGTYTYSALTYARTQMFQEQNGMRTNVTHTAIIVTDGQSNDFNETVHQAELLKAAGVTIYSVGVGLTNQDELLLIASRPSYVFTVENYDLIDQIAGPLAGITCSSTHGTSDEGSG